MWKVVPEGRVWGLWFRLRFGSGVGVVDISEEGAEGAGGCEGCLRWRDGTFSISRWGSDISGIRIAVFFSDSVG